MTPFQAVLSIIGTFVGLSGLLLAIASFRTQAYQRAQAEREERLRRDFGVEQKLDGPTPLASRLSDLTDRLDSLEEEWERRLNEKFADLSAQIKTASGRSSEAANSCIKEVGGLALKFSDLRGEFGVLREVVNSTQRELNNLRDAR